jgi:glyoxylase-like metal-dependent hydrolase (beta-lactamase superfamily II)
MSATYERGVLEIGDGLYAYLQPDGSWGWSNAGLITGGGEALLVDTLFDLKLTAAMLDEFRRRVPEAGRITRLVNTHANGDHCYGNQLVAGAEIIASTACAEEMSEVTPATLASLVESAPRLGTLGEYVRRIFGPFDFSGITVTPPTRTFDRSLSLDVGSTAVELVEVGPAHTRGDVLVRVGSVVFTGDILFVGGHPIVWAGPVANWVAALDRILEMGVQTVVPGHGPVTGLGAVRDMKQYFEFVTQEAGERFRAGMTPLDAARDIDPGPYKDWGDGERLVANVAALYRELGGTADTGPAGVLGLMAEFGTMP